MAGSIVSELTEVKRRVLSLERRLRDLRLVKYLHQSRIVHVGAWEIEHHTPTRAWVFGPGKDKPKPAPQPQRVVEIRYYEKAKARREQLRALHSLAANTPHFNQARRA